MKKIVYFAVLVVFTLSFMACDDFFSKSWGSSRDYDPSKIDVDAGNVDDWVKDAVGNPALADAVVKKIKQKMKDYPRGSKDGAKLLEGGIKLAVESSGLGESILSNAADALGDLGSDKTDEELEDMVKDILSKIQDDFNTSGGPEAANDIAEMLGDNIDVDDFDYIPRLDPAYAETAKPGDVAEAILVLVLGILDEKHINIESDDEESWKDIEKLAENLDFTGDHVIVTGTPVDDKALALAAYINLIADDESGKFMDNPLTSAIWDAFNNN